MMRIYPLYPFHFELNQRRPIAQSALPFKPGFQPLHYDLRSHLYMAPSDNYLDTEKIFYRRCSNCFVGTWRLKPSAFVLHDRIIGICLFAFCEGQVKTTQILPPFPLLPHPGKSQWAGKT